METLNPPLHCKHVNGDFLFVTHKLSDQEYLANDEQGDWSVVLRDDLQDFDPFVADDAESEFE